MTISAVSPEKNIVTTISNTHPGKLQPHIVMIIPRGEAVRNFLYSDTLRCLSEHARVTLLSVVSDEKFMGRFSDLADQIIPLRLQPERRMVKSFRFLLHEAHFLWLDSAVARNVWEIRAAKARSLPAKLKRTLIKGLMRPLANRPSLETLTRFERYLSWKLRTGDELVDLFKRLNPDLVFNGSHIHGPAGELPVKIAHRLGIPTAGFIFSWDNLTSRSRIFVPYDYYFVWHQGMRDQLLSIYPNIPPERVFITGTPQFDFHFKPEFWLTREELCRQIGIDPQRPFVLYTTGIAKHFPEEHRTVALVAKLLQTMDISPKPQLVVRTYVKGTSPEMKALASQNLPDVIFPPVRWEEKWYTPMVEDLAIYTGLIRYARLGINAASTVSLELLMHDKPVINLGFDPPGSQIPHAYRWIRHIDFDHYRPVAESGAVMIARSESDMGEMLRIGLIQPNKDSEKRHDFVKRIFGNTLDGESGRRVAEQLINLSKAKA